MINIQKMWQKLGVFLKVDNALEEGFSNGKYTKILAKYAKNVVAIDISKDFLKIATKYLEDNDNVELKLMNAEKLEFSDKSFDVVLSTSFHEFDLKNDEYSLDLELKEKILKEMIRVSDTIIFVEPAEDAITNELFKVFNPVENHTERIKQSNSLIEKVMNKSRYKKVLEGYSFNEDKYNSQEELEDDMLDWWSDIKIPKDLGERKRMISSIDGILDNAGMLSELKVIEKIKYWVFQREMKKV